MMSIVNSILGSQFHWSMMLIVFALFLGRVLILIPPIVVVTFCVSHRRRKMYCGHARLFVCQSVCVSVCVCLSAAVRPHYCTDPDVTWRRGRGCPLVVHYWADLQSVHGLHCYGNITRTLVYAGCARVAD